MVSVDVRGGHVSTAGWTVTTDLAAATVAADLFERGVRELVYTNVDRDGLLEGPDLHDVRASRALCRPASPTRAGSVGLPT